MAEAPKNGGMVTSGTFPPRKLNQEIGQRRRRTRVNKKDVLLRQNTTTAVERKHSRDPSLT